MPTIGREVLKPPRLKAMLVELNEAMDGPAGIALQFTTAGPPILVCVENDDDAVVHLPGDGKTFPVRAYVNALLVSKVLEEK